MLALLALLIGFQPPSAGRTMPLLHPATASVVCSASADRSVRECRALDRTPLRSTLGALIPMRSPARETDECTNPPGDPLYTAAGDAFLCRTKEQVAESKRRRPTPDTRGRMSVCALVAVPSRAADTPTGVIGTEHEPADHPRCYRLIRSGPAVNDY